MNHETDARARADQFVEAVIAKLGGHELYDDAFTGDVSTEMFATFREALEEVGMPVSETDTLASATSTPAEVQGLLAYAYVYRINSEDPAAQQFDTELAGIASEHGGQEEYRAPVHDDFRGLDILSIAFIFMDNEHSL